MITIRALVVDDQPKLVESMKTRIGREIRAMGWEVDWADATDVDEGKRLMARAATPFDLVIADLIFPREDFPDQAEPRGLELIKDASGRSRHTFILAVSTGSDHLHDLMDQASQFGAHHVLRRTDFSTASAVHSPAAIAAKIQAHLLDNGTVPTCEVIADPRDPAIQGLLHRVGEATVARLYAKVLEPNGRRPRQIELGFLTPGASGAAICTVTADLGEAGRTSHILKLSQTPDQLAREAERGRAAAEKLPPHLLVQHNPAHSVGPVNGWYALGGPLIERAPTLRGWLRSGGATAAAVGDVLEVLLTENLGRMYAAGRIDAVDPMRSFAFTPYRQSCILQELDDLAEALRRDDGGALGHEADVVVRGVRTFITDHQLPGGVTAPSTSYNTYICHQHGDLHAGNVLIVTGRRNWPLLIDPSHFGLAHWARDLASLAIDLIMHSVDAGTESMLFTGFGTWRTLARQVGAGEPELTAVTATPATSAALSALSWLVENLHKVTPALRPALAASPQRWEWHLALAHNLLRSTYHSDIPHPKRALAFAAAYDQLNAAAGLLPGSGLPGVYT
jgi:CheY-like chemotaxis protein